MFCLHIIFWLYSAGFGGGGVFVGAGPHHHLHNSMTDSYLVLLHNSMTDSYLVLMYSLQIFMAKFIFPLKVKINFHSFSMPFFCRCGHRHWWRCVYLLVFIVAPVMNSVKLCVAQVSLMMNLKLFLSASLIY